MAGTIAELEREGISSANAMAKALNERGVHTARSGRWAAQTVIALRRRLKAARALATRSRNGETSRNRQRPERGHQ
jgi:hypothetical protein